MPADVPLHPTNCDFHRFAWQSFWHLVQPSDTSPGSLLRFEKFMPARGLLVSEGQPVPYGQTPPGPCPTNVRTHVLKPQSLRGLGHLGLNSASDEQATDDVLIDQAGRPVYYEQLINKVEYDYLTSCGLYQQGCLDAANNLPDPTEVQLPPGSMEVKTAWRILDAPDPSYYTVTGLVEQDDGQCAQVTVGLVGMHIVTRTPNHPELIWATFEHRNNGPDCDNPQAPPPGGWSFNDPSCSAADCPPNEPTTAPTPAQLCRVNPQGGGTTENRQNIQALNASMHAVMPEGSVWQNYELVGTIWTLRSQGDKGVIPPEPARQGGSVASANLVMESFFQGPSVGSNPGQALSCFTCHSFSGGSPIQLSNLMTQIAQDGGCADGNMPATCGVPLVSP